MGIHYTLVSGEPSNLAADVMFKPAAWSTLSKTLPHLGMGVFNALISFEGWYIISTFVEEIKNPAKNIPLLTLTVLPFITFVCVAVNVVMLTVLSQEEMASSLRLFQTFVVKASGKSMGYLVCAFIPVCGVAGLLGYLYHLSRVVLSSAREGQLPEMFSYIHRKSRTPVFATLYCTLAATIAILTTDINQSLIFSNAALWLEYAMGISTVIVLRKTRPHVERPYRVYLTTPVFVLLVCAALLTSTLWTNTIQGVIVLIVIASGVVIHRVATCKTWFGEKYSQKVLTMCEALNMIKCEFNRQ